VRFPLLYEFRGIERAKNESGLGIQTFACL